MTSSLPLLGLILSTDLACNLWTMLSKFANIGCKNAGAGAPRPIDFCPPRVYRRAMQRPIPSSEQCLAIASLDDRPDADLYNAAFALLYGCGIWQREALDIRRRDVLISERMRLSITGSRKRMLPVPKGAADRVLLAMNRGHGHSDDDFLFFRKGKRISKLGWVLTQRSNVLGLARPLTTSDLRLAFAVHMMDGQTPLELVAAMMGYSNPNKLCMALTGSFF